MVLSAAFPSVELWRAPSTAETHPNLNLSAIGRQLRSMPLPLETLAAPPHRPHLQANDM